MHGWNRIRRVWSCVALAALLLAATPAEAAPHRRGWLKVLPVLGGDSTDVTYLWAPGRNVELGDPIQIQERVEGSWVTIARSNIDDNAGCSKKVCANIWAWDTREATAGKHVIRIVVLRPLAFERSSSPVWIDHDPPAVDIMPPSGSTPIGDDPTTGEKTYAVDGPAELRAFATDARIPGAGHRIRGRWFPFGGVGFWRWTVRHDASGETRTFEPFRPRPFSKFTYDFGAKPGAYTVTFEIRDQAWNLGTDTIHVISHPATGI